MRNPSPVASGLQSTLAPKGLWDLGLQDLGSRDLSEKRTARYLAGQTSGQPAGIPVLFGRVFVVSVG